MSFDPLIVEARLALDMVHLEDMPALAWDALEAGLDGPAICRLAALLKPSGWETDQIKPRFMLEARLQSISQEVACVRIAQQLAHRILSEGLDPLLYTKDFEALWIRAGDPTAIQEAGSLDDEKYVYEYMGRSQKDLREYALTILGKLVESTDSLI